MRSRYNGPMSFVRLYGRVLEKLGADRRVGWLLALANVALAMAQFAEPVLFGRVINVLARRAGESTASAHGRTCGCCFWPGSGFGLFTIVCGTMVALYADRLAHRRRLAVLDRLFRARPATAARPITAKFIPAG